MSVKSLIKFEYDIEKLGRKNFSFGSGLHDKKSRGTCQYDIEKLGSKNFSFGSAVHDKKSRGTCQGDPLFGYR